MDHSDRSVRGTPTGLNFYLAAGHLLANLYQFFLLPLYLLPLSGWWGLTLVPLALLSNSFWSLIHEAIHDSFHPASRINRLAGRLLSVFFGGPFCVLRLSHLLHHKFNRTPLEGTELYQPERGSRARAGVGYYLQILGGLYLIEAISSWPFFFPRKLLRLLERRFFSRDNLSGILWRSLMKDETIREVRLDGAVILALWGVSAVCYGGNWRLLAGALFLRAFLISFLDNVYHYRTPVNDIWYARNLRLPQWTARMLLHFNLHGVHHRSPALPWTLLPEAFAAQSGHYDGDYFVAALRQLSGPVPLSDLPAAGAAAHPPSPFFPAQPNRERRVLGG